MGCAKRTGPVILFIPEYSGAGIYALINVSSGRMYIGSAINIRQRIKSHDTRMRNGYPNERFKSDVAMGDFFTTIILEKMDSPTKAELLEKEASYIKHFNALSDGYNRKSILFHDSQNN